MTITSNTVILITGASSGIGAALATRLAAKGAKVALAARRRAHLDAVADRVREAGGTPLVLQADVGEEHDCRRIVDATVDHFGTINVLVNNAGRGNLASVEDTSTDQLERIMRLNVYAPFWSTAQALPVMKANGRGHIITVASVAGRMGYPFNAAYVMAKHAVVGFTAALRAELYGTDIHATVINPAGVITEWADATEGGPIAALYTQAIPHSRTVAKEHGWPLAPLSRMMPADEAAHIIEEAIERGRGNDVFTHKGTMEQAAEAVTDRMALEDKFASLYVAMHDVYPQLRHPSNE
jgi:short-subunit dehydrogenase